MTSIKWHFLIAGTLILFLYWYTGIIWIGILGIILLIASLVADS